MNIFSKAYDEAMKVNEASLYANNNEYPEEEIGLWNMYKEADIAESMIAMRIFSDEINHRMRYLNSDMYAESVGGIFIAALGILKTVAAFILKLILGFKGMLIIVIGAIIAFLINRAKGKSIASVAGGGGGSVSSSSVGTSLTEKDMDDIVNDAIKNVNIPANVIRERAEEMVGGDFNISEYENLSVEMAKSILNTNDIDNLTLEVLKSSGKAVLDRNKLGEFMRLDKGVDNEGYVVLKDDAIVNLAKAMVKNIVRKDSGIKKRILQTIKSHPIYVNATDLSHLENDRNMKIIADNLIDSGSKSNVEKFEDFIMHTCIANAAGLIKASLSTQITSYYLITGDMEKSSKLVNSISSISGRMKGLELIEYLASRNASDSINNDRDNFVKNTEEYKSTLLKIINSGNGINIKSLDGMKDLADALEMIGKRMTESVNSLNSLDFEIIEAGQLRDGIIIKTFIFDKNKKSTPESRSKFIDAQTMFVSKLQELKDSNVYDTKVVRDILDKLTDSAKEVTDAIKNAPTEGKNTLSSDMRNLLESYINIGSSSVRCAMVGVNIVTRIFQSLKHPVNILIQDIITDLVKGMLADGLAMLTKD